MSEQVVKEHTTARSHTGAGGAADFRVDGLQAYLDLEAPSIGRLESVTKFPGGQSNPTYRIHAATRLLVLRRKPFGPLTASAHAIEREFRVMKALEPSAVPVPQVLLYCADPRVIGAPFYLMEFVEGQVHWDACLPEMATSVRRRIYADMGRVLADLHSIDPSAVGLVNFGRPGNDFERQIYRWTQQYRLAETERQDDMERLIAWLPAHLPPDDGLISVTHGDYRLDNLVFGSYGRALAVLDWELSTLGHPYADLAYQCAQWRLPAGEMRGLKGIDRTAIGLPTEEEYVAAYLERRGGPPIQHWTFYLVVSLFRLASICQGVYRRGVDGNASSADALSFGRRSAIIAAHAADLTA